MHDDTNATTIEYFLDEGLITKVLRPIRSGKEASVHLCRANRSTTGRDLVALKVYHPLDRRDFRDESIYRDGEWIKERRIRVALAKKTRFGREVQGGIWVHREWETLQTLAAAGAAVPEPIAWTGDAILMSYVGDDEAAAPQLHRYRPDPDEARSLFDQLMAQVERFLYGNVIHGDLSPFNVLVWEGRVTVIDLPQAVDPRKNRHAEHLLERDVRRICDHFARLGVGADPGRLTRDLWTAWTFADLVPEDLRTELIVDP
ncbi:MAG TPA: RIO1 family regulatory kinase/ATPase [Actinomycetota bacterium]|nr:RIO1 family regulatory kinase/ATPase [Actinomycetota bacterium]